MSINTELGKHTSIDLKDLLRKIVFHWPLLLVVILLSTAAAFLYLRYTTPRYLASARLYLKDEKKGGEEMDALRSLSILSDNKNIENEMEVLRSPLLLQKVLTDSRFNIRYFRIQPVRDAELYDRSPLTLNVLSNRLATGNYKFVVIPTAKHISLVYRDRKRDTVMKMELQPGQAFSIRQDTFSITLSPELARDPGGQSYRIRVDSIQELAYQKAEEINTTLSNKESTVIMVSYTDAVAKRSAELLNALMDAYNDYTLEDKNKASLKTTIFLTERIDSLRTELAVLEGAEQQFKIQRGITDIEANAKLALEEIKDADLRLNEANTQLSVYDEIEKHVNDPSNTTPFAPLAGIVDQSLAGMINRYEELRKERKRLSLSLQPGSQINQNLDAQIADAAATIRKYISGYRRNAGTAQQKMQQKVNAVQSRIANIPAYEREYINLKRQQSVKESLYLYLLKKKEEASVAYASNVTDNKVIAPAFVPDKPISPKKPLTFVSFIAVGILLTLGYIYAKYFLNSRVLSRHEIEQAVSKPVIAEIYQQTEDSDLRAFNGRSVLLEQVMNLRTNLKFLLNGQTDAITILITSSTSGEGKTFITAHLGNALTANNKRVLLLELDLRKPKLSKFLGLDSNTGITNYLTSNLPLEQCIRKVPGREGLSIISAGPIPPNPAELIESARMKTLLQELKSQFDYILIDTAPIGIISDAKSLAHSIDCTLYIVRYNYTLKSNLKIVEDNIREGVFKKTGIIFNGINQNTFYPYYYYNSYTYMENGNGHGHTKKWTPVFKKIKQRFV
ncbi:MAG TPA: polysaccharide biosynthesis tyrosine autokinase [Chitinophaga sp.]|uniref:GumC family protein n=1 Tax=Chitinophaga sp. TaxID=1869181 RepID=UPI002C34B990|nr:polysaccharide biosynthesis tyrosine autokinase [Chitinophaga sp.]HVI44792.1 polysaccharide biosynthesis tyrosine autokinase [Chitinophaga sp.]